MSFLTVTLIIAFCTGWLLSPALLGFLLRLLWKTAAPEKVAAIAALPFVLFIMLSPIMRRILKLCENEAPTWADWVPPLIFTILGILLWHRICSAIAKLGISLSDRISSRKHRGWIELNPAAMS